MDHAEALGWWVAHANYEQRTPTPDDLKLHRMHGLLARLGDPHRRLRIVHVAGSKGKGSCAAMLATIFRCAGYRTGLFTSPHLCRLEERFQVDGQAISEGELTQLLNEIRNVVDRDRDFAATPPTYFEIATAIGFLHFVRRRVEAAVLEVGLGGRLDSTNVCLPAVSVITSISYDHVLILGDRLAMIAREKAGIIKRRRPVVSGATVPEARAVIEQVCREREAPLIELERDVRHTYIPGQVNRHGTILPRLQVTTAERAWPTMSLKLHGAHQTANAAVVVACVEQLRKQGFHLSDYAVSRGLAEVDWPARMEVVGYAPLMVLDCAHNVASAEALVETLLTSFPPARRLLVFAGSGDKDVAGMFRVLGPHFARAWMTRYTASARAVPPEQLATAWASASAAPVEVCGEPAEALACVRGEAREDDLVCITGSVFLAGELRPLLCGSHQS